MSFSLLYLLFLDLEAWNFHSRSCTAKYLSNRACCPRVNRRLSTRSYIPITLYSVQSIQTSFIPRSPIQKVPRRHFRTRATPTSLLANHRALPCSLQCMPCGACSTCRPIIRRPPLTLRVSESRSLKELTNRQVYPKDQAQKTIIFWRHTSLKTWRVTSMHKL